MNTNPGLIGTKLGNTQIFLDDGEVRRVTAIKAGPCVVVGKRTPDKDGYSALQLGFGEKREKLVKKPQAGAMKKAGVQAPRVIREFRIDESLLERFEVGQTLGVADIFQDGQFVDVSGTSKGRGFSGVMKRHNFAGQRATHGVKKVHRHAGGTGCSAYPSRLFKGKKIAGQYGNARITSRNLRVFKIDAENHLLLVRGAVPGPNGGFVVIRETNKLG